MVTRDRGVLFIGRRRCDERGSGRRCTRDAVGAIGMIHYCFECIAALCEMSPDDVRLRDRWTIELHDDGRHVGFVEWVPYRSQTHSRV